MTSDCRRINLDAVISAVKLAGYGDDIQWAENLAPPTDADEFALEVIFVICNSGMRFTVARTIYERVIASLAQSVSSSKVFKHTGKCVAIDHVWYRRHELYAAYLRAADKLTYLETLPWIGGITKYHLAKNFGLQYAKPDVHMQRLAGTFHTTPQALCEQLSAEHGLKVATVDTLLWRAAAIGKLNTSTGEVRP
jgi:hypothetical protein